MATSSAPGKVYLFGEHAVVYGEPAMPCAIERRATVTAERRSDSRLRVNASDLTLDGFTVEYSGPTTDAPALEAHQPLVKAGIRYIERAIEAARTTAERPKAGLDVTIESDLPLGAGLGSSAAVVVAAIDAAARELGVTPSRRAVADRAYEVEYDVQEGQASRADTFCSATGGAARIEGENCRAVETPALPFVIGYDGGTGDTGDLVAGVRELRATYDFAADTIEAIGDLVRDGERALEAGDLRTLGDLMDFNHGLLSALGVSARSLDTMVWSARDAGALGAKLTGSGGGGCIVALDDSPETERALEYTVGCVESFRADLDTDGLRREV